MGAFFLYKKDSDIDLEAVRFCFAEKGFKKPIIRDFGLYKLWLYKKIMIDVDNFIEQEIYSIYAVGTVVYKGMDYLESLKQILKDFTKKNLDFDKLIGSFFLLIKAKEKYYFFTDRAGIQNVFYYKNKEVISSSFLALIYASKKPLHINILAMTEILATGNLIGPDTLIKEIHRFLIHTPRKFDRIQQLYNMLEQKISDYCKDKYENCLLQQIEILEDYFKSIKNLADKYGLSSGITGGLDSRLLLILIKKFLTNFQFFSTWRKIKDKSFIAAEKVCRTASLELRTIHFTYPLEMDEEMAHETLYQSFLFMDGQIRTHHLWTEEISTRAYRETLFGDKRISINGVGGEQYRNSERMILPRWNFNNWLTYELVYRHSGNCFKKKREKEYFLEYLGNKIKSRVKNSNLKYINHLSVKRYFNEVYNPANRTVWTNAENQIAFCLSPYTDYHLSMNAYSIIPHLGLSQKFEIDMIRRLDPEIASIETDYGYDLIKGEPFHKRYITYFKEFTPFKLYYKLYELYKPGSSFYQDYEKKFPFVKTNTKRLYDLNLAINLEKIKSNHFLSPLIISMGYFINKLKDKIQL
jgi:hypothetical protein